MANDSQLRASEIKDVLLKEIDRYEEDLQAEEIGEVLELKAVSYTHLRAHET